MTYPYQRLVHFIGKREEYIPKWVKDREEKLEFSTLGEKIGRSYQEL